MDSTESYTPSLQGKIKVTACNSFNCSHKEECIGKWFRIDTTKLPIQYGKDYERHFITPWRTCCIWNSGDGKWSYELEKDTLQCKCPKAAKQKK